MQHEHFNEILLKSFGIEMQVESFKYLLNIHFVGREIIYHQI